MKKSLFVAAVAALALVACNKKETTVTAETVDSAATAMVDSAAVTVDSAAATVDSAAATVDSAAAKVEAATEVKK